MAGGPAAFSVGDTNAGLFLFNSANDNTGYGNVGYRLMYIPSIEDQVLVQ